jgi:hypothetical protein
MTVATVPSLEDIRVREVLTACIYINDATRDILFYVRY